MKLECDQMRLKPFTNSDRENLNIKNKFLEFPLKSLETKNTK